MSNRQPAITDTIGQTPLVRLQNITKDLPATALVKGEFGNPLGSVKDRIGRAMIEGRRRTANSSPARRSSSQPPATPGSRSPLSRQPRATS
jgi:cysteine synthase